MGVSDRDDSGKQHQGGLILDRKLLFVFKSLSLYFNQHSLCFPIMIGYAKSYVKCPWSAWRRAVICQRTRLFEGGI